MPRIHRRAVGPSHRVVVIDDDHDLLETTTALLRAEGHEVRGASDGASGIELVRTVRPDLVLLDYYLGDRTGADVVRAIRTFDALAQVLLVTGYASEQPARALLRDLDIQGYHDKSDGADRLLVLVDAALKHGRALRRIERQRTALRTILDLAPEVHRLQPPADLLQTAVQGLARLVGGGDALVAAHNSGLFALEEAAATVSIHVGTGRFAGAQTLRDVPDALASVVRDALTDLRPTLRDERWVTLPLVTTSGTRGCMVVAASSFDEDLVDPCAIYGKQVVQAFENVLLYERATVDPLTRLANRQHGLARLADALELAQRTGTSTAVVACDVDAFKAINDTYGHAAGDRTLRAIARALSGLLRASDVAVRLGGDEFVLILPGTDEPGAVALADRLQAHVQAMEVAFEDAQLGTSLSVGVAVAAPGDLDVDALLHRADVAMYRDKAARRMSARTTERRVAS